MRVKWYKIISKTNGNSIFLPASSRYSIGGYWSNLVDSSHCQFFAKVLVIRAELSNSFKTPQEPRIYTNVTKQSHAYGMSVRPVLHKNNKIDR